MIKNRGYRHFSLNNPYKNHYSELNPAEKELGGVPPQNQKIGEQQYYATQTYVEDHIGYAKQEGDRAVGTIGNFPFNRTLKQLRKVDLAKRTKFDAYISMSLSLIGNQKRIVTTQEPVSLNISEMFPKYDNSGYISQLI